MKPMRVGVVGTGFGERVVAPIFRAIGCDVDVVSARDRAAVERLCEADVDLVSIHSPPFLHLDHARMAIAAGRAVLCDKPLGTSLEEATSLADAAEAAGVVNLVNFEFRHQPARRRMKELLEAGAIGHPEHLHYVALTSGSRVPLRPYGWLFDRSRGGGWIGAFGSHAIDTVRWLLGEIESAGGATWTTITERPDAQGRMHACSAEDAFNAWLELEGGARATIDTSFTSAVSLPPRIVVTGSEGAIDNTADARLVLRRVDGHREELEFSPPRGDPHEVAMTAWATEVCRAVTEGRQVSPSFRDGVACARVMDALRAETPRPRAG